jgi:hypothetical protein
MKTVSSDKLVRIDVGSVEAMATNLLKKVIAMTDKNNELEETMKTLKETVNTIKAKLESITCDL